jgi:hypothetical protein
MRGAVHVALTGEKTAEPEGKIPPGRPWHRWEDNIKLCFKEIEWQDFEWINTAPHRDRW